MSARWRALARALGPVASSSSSGGAIASLSQAQALSASSLSTSTIGDVAALASSATTRLLSNPNVQQRRSFSADAAAVAPPPPDDPSPPPPPPPTSGPTKPPPSPPASGNSSGALVRNHEGDGDDEEGHDASLTPSEVVARLDRHIVGQPDAKRAVANALRARWRRRRVPEDLRAEIVPKNILMIGPTGCGKTEVARRLARLADAPFVKVEATKFTEVGFHGRDVDSIIRDLVDASVQRARERARERLRRRIAAAVEDRILVALCGEGAGQATVDAFRELYRSGALDERKVAIELPGGLGIAGAGGGGLGGFGGLGGTAGLFGGAPGAAGGAAAGGSVSGRSPLAGGPLDNASGAIAVQEVIMRVDKLLGGSGRGGGGRGGGGSSTSNDGRREMRVADARALVEEAEAERLISPEQVAREAVASAESDGIVFIDEIDKIVVNHETRYGGGGADASSEGVQRDLLPIIEGSVVATKHGNVSTDHMLFICSGAFSACKPSDMLAELQGRLPIRVELKALTADDFYRILTEPEANMLSQQRALLATEGVELRFTDGAARAIAEAAAEANAALDNIGARRLHTVLERVLELVSFDAPETAAKARAEAAAAAAVSLDDPSAAAAASSSAATAVVEVDEEFVKERMGDLLQRQDLSRYVL